MCMLHDVRVRVIVNINTWQRQQCNLNAATAAARTQTRPSAMVRAMARACTLARRSSTFDGSSRADRFAVISPQEASNRSQGLIYLSVDGDHL